MGSHRKMGDSARLPAISHRFSCAARVEPPLCTATEKQPPRLTGEPVAACERWLAIDFEIDRLAQQWARLETQMAREFGWFSLSQVERRALPQAAEMFEIEERLDRLSDEREHRLTSLAKLKAKDLHGVASKLAIAARVLRHDGGPAHQLVADAVNALATRCCPDCGAPYVTGAARL